ncbi:uncharacterized protein [Dermacentor albipictus]|uniref:uncharacterized protein isoform X2 n=1 Tax=Dermacentor albipictus TaxID=60249 RepID=UPI0038FD20FA
MATQARTALPKLPRLASGTPSGSSAPYPSTPRNSPCEAAPPHEQAAADPAIPRRGASSAAVPPSKPTIGAHVEGGAGRVERGSTDSSALRFAVVLLATAVLFSAVVSVAFVLRASRASRRALWKRMGNATASTPQQAAANDTCTTVTAPGAASGWKPRPSGRASHRPARRRHRTIRGGRPTGGTPAALYVDEVPDEWPVFKSTVCKQYQFYHMNRSEWISMT